MEIHRSHRVRNALISIATASPTVKAPKITSRVNLKDPDYFGIVFREGAELCGIAIGDKAGGVGWIDWLSIDPKRHGRGLGKRLMAETERSLRKAGCRQITLLTYPALTPAISLYLRAGMVPEAFLRQQTFGEDYLMRIKWLRPYKRKGAEPGLPRRPGRQRSR